MCEAGLRGLSLRELSCVYWVCRLEHGDFWQEDVTNKCDITIRYVSCAGLYSLEVSVIMVSCEFINRDVRYLKDAEFLYHVINS
jgi:hypothetical protein